MRLQKAVVVGLAGMLSLSLGACGSSGPDTSSPESTVLSMLKAFEEGKPSQIASLLPEDSLSSKSIQTDEDASKVSERISEGKVTGSKKADDGSTVVSYSYKFNGKTENAEASLSFQNSDGKETWLLNSVPFATVSGTKGTSVNGHALSGKTLSAIPGVYEVEVSKDWEEGKGTIPLKVGFSYLTQAEGDKHITMKPTSKYKDLAEKALRRQLSGTNERECGTYLSSFDYNWEFSSEVTDACDSFVSGNAQVNKIDDLAITQVDEKTFEATVSGSMTVLDSDSYDGASYNQEKYLESTGYTCNDGYNGTCLKFTTKQISLDDLHAVPNFTLLEQDDKQFSVSFTKESAKKFSKLLSATPMKSTTGIPNESID